MEGDFDLPLIVGWAISDILTAVCVTFGDDTDEEWWWKSEMRGPGDGRSEQRTDANERGARAKRWR
jgi:hypothetical protein